MIWPLNQLRELLDVRPVDLVFWVLGNFEREIAAAFGLLRRATASWSVELWGAAAAAAVLAAAAGVVARRPAAAGDDADYAAAARPVAAAEPAAAAPDRAGGAPPERRATPLRRVRKGLARATGKRGFLSGKRADAAAAPAPERAELVVAGRLPYHEASGLERAPGYVGCLDATQADALARLLERCRGLDLARHVAPRGETVEQLALRFLRARRFSVDRAAAMLAADVAWRQDVCQLEALRAAEPEAVAGLGDASRSTDALARLFPMWIEGTDTQGRPVFYKPFASWRLDELVNRHGATPATLCAYLTYAQDRAFHVALGNASRERSVEQVVVVLDALRLRWAWGLPSRDGVRITRAMVRLDEAHYPERLGALYILNAGKVFARGWRLIRGLVDEKTRAKIHILDGPEDYVPVLKAAIGEDNLAEEYGGRGLAKRDGTFFDPITKKQRRSETYAKEAT